MTNREILFIIKLRNDAKAALKSLGVDLKDVKAQAQGAAGQLMEVATASGMAAAEGTRTAQSFRGVAAGCKTMTTMAQAAAKQVLEVGVAVELAGKEAVSGTKNLQGYNSELTDAQARAKAATAAIKEMGAAVGKASNGVAGGGGSGGGGGGGGTRNPRPNNQPRNNAGVMGQTTLNLTRQMADVFTTGAMGMSPMMILIQQGPQIADAFQTAAAAGLSFKQVLAGLVAQIAPFAAMAAGILALAGAFFVLFKSAEDWNEQQSRATLTLRGLGAASRATVKDIEAVGQAQADAGAMSAKSGRDFALAFATAKVPVEELGKSVSLVRGYAALTGKDMKDAGKELAAAFADPATGASKLNDMLGFLNASELKHIQHLQAQGDRAGALKVLMDRLGVSIGDATPRVNKLGEAWALVGRKAQDAWDWMGKAMARTLDERNESRDILTGRRDMFQPGSKGYQKYQTMLDQMDREAAATAKRQAQQAASERSNNLADAFSGLNPSVKQIDDIQTKQKLLRGSLNDPKALAAAGMTKEQAEEAIRAGERQIAQIKKRSEVTDRHAESLARQAEAMAVNTREALNAAAAYLKSDAAGAKAEAHRKAATEATQKGLDIAKQVARQLNLEAAQAAENGAKTVAGLRSETEARKQGNDDVVSGALALADLNDQLGTEAALRPLLIAQQNAEGDSLKRLTEVITAYREALTDSRKEAIRTDALVTGRGQDRDIEALRTQIRMAGDLTGAREKALAVARAQQEADDKKYDAEEKRAYVEKAGTIAQLQLDARRADFIANTTRAQALAAQQTQIEIDFAGKSSDARDRKIAQMQMENALLEQGIPLQSEIGQSILRAADNAQLLGVRLRDALSGKNLNVLESAKLAAGQFVDELELGGITMKDAFANAFRGAEDALVKFVSTGKLEIKDLVDSALADLARLAIQQAEKAFFKNVLKIGSTAIGMAHSGGLANPTLAGRKTVDPTIFAGAKRFHSGGIPGLKSGEVPIIAKENEAIMPTVRLPDGSFGVKATGVGAGGQGVVVHFAPTIQVTVQGSEGADGQGHGEAIARTLLPALQQMVQDQIINQMRAGGLLHAG